MHIASRGAKSINIYVGHCKLFMQINLQSSVNNDELSIIYSIVAISFSMMKIIDGKSKTFTSKYLQQKTNNSYTREKEEINYANIFFMLKKQTLPLLRICAFFLFLYDLFCLTPAVWQDRQDSWDCRRLMRKRETLSQREDLVQATRKSERRERRPDISSYTVNPKGCLESSHGISARF